MIAAIGIPQEKLCTACFDGDYLDKPDEEGKMNCEGGSCARIFD